ncbi:MAG: thiol:disulfide oxidoreductase [Alphaproteobacteria bacterium]|nr:thiol:disulfide oxidoreductase [Alphaproteobacteria bacterium]
MIDLYYWSTPNGHKIGIFMEEAGLEYRLIPVNIGKGDQFKPDFLKISPNNRMPAIVDHKPADGAAPLSVFESGAILLYLADKTGKFLPADARGRANVTQWVMWQMGGLGPMAGQNGHFNTYAPEKIPYAVDRYVKETGRLYAVLNKQLSGKNYICGDYSIADMACYPWIVPYERHMQDINDFPNLKIWFERMKARPAVERAYAKGSPMRESPVMSEEDKKVLFGQTAQVVR